MTFAEESALRTRIFRLTNKGQWSTTRYAGGFNFNGHLRVFGGTNEEFGEPQTIPATDHDTQFIAEAPAIILEQMNEIERLRSENARLKRENQNHELEVTKMRSLRRALRYALLDEGVSTLG